jgi:uncharacterized membrane protein YhiD involved in acid resistance
MWLAGATGLGVGLGFWQIALVVTIIALIVLGALRLFEPDSEHVEEMAKPAEEPSPTRGKS